MKLTRRRVCRAGAVLVCAAAAPRSFAADKPAEHQITHLLKSTFERSGAPLSVEPVVVLGNHGIAGWVQDGRGGRALMRRVNGEWTVHLCSGDPLKDADVLKNSGVPEVTALALARALADAEAKLPSKTIALLGSFEGTVMIGPGGHHPPTHGSHKH